MKVTIRKSNRPQKKWMAEFENGRVVHFGATGYQDFTQHKDPERMRRYKLRHGSGREKHGKSGMYTAGFWSMWLLWNKPSLQASAKDMEKRFGLKISFSKGRMARKSTSQRTSRKMRMRKIGSRKMKALGDRISDPDVLENILTYLPASKVMALASASSTDKYVSEYVLNKQSKEYFAEFNAFLRYVSPKGNLDLTDYNTLRRYMELDDTDNLLGATTMTINMYARLTSMDGRRLIPRGVNSVKFINPIKMSRMSFYTDKKWFDNYFYSSSDAVQPIQPGELPEGLEYLEGLYRSFEISALPSTLREIHFENLSSKMISQLAMLPDSIREIRIPMSDFDAYTNDILQLPQSVQDKIIVVLIEGFRNPASYDDEYEEEESNFTIEEAIKALNEREEYEMERYGY